MSPIQKYVSRTKNIYYVTAFQPSSGLSIVVKIDLPGEDVKTIDVDVETERMTLYRCDH